MGIYILSALGLLIKIYIFFASREIENKTLFYSMLSFFAIHNLSELLGLFAMMNGYVPLFLLKAYYAATFCALTFMVIFSMTVSKIESLKVFMRPVGCIGLAIAAVTFGTDFIIKGVINIGYTPAADKGDFYFIFPSFVLFSLIFTIVTLLTGTKKAATTESSIQSFIVLLALSPLLISSFILLPIIISGIKINAAGIVPICTTAFLFIILKSESIHKMTDVRRWLPFSPERKLAQDFVRLSGLYSSEQMDYKTFSTEIERLSLKYKYLQSDKNITKMSKMMGLHRTTVYSMMSRHDVKNEEK